MLQGLAHTICVYAKKASGGGGDNTPAAVNWSNVSSTRVGKSTTYVYSAQQITGISTSITLKTEFSNSALVEMYYKVQSTGTVPSSSSDPASNGYTNIRHNDTLTVSNNQYVVFGVQSGTGVTTSSTITVKNNSDGNATLDTFTATKTVP